MKSKLLSFIRKNWYLVSVLLAGLTTVLFIVGTQQRATERENLANERKRMALTLSALRQKALRFEEQDEPLKAAETYAKAIEIHKEKATHLLVREASLLSELGPDEQERALALLRRYLQESVDLSADEKAVAYELQGDCFVGLGDQEKASDAFAAAIAARPHGGDGLPESRLRYKTAMAMLLAGRMADAVGPLEAALDLDPTPDVSAKSLALLARIRFAEKKYAKVVERAAEISAKFAPLAPRAAYGALIYAARAEHAQEGHLAKAAAFFVAAARTIPNNDRQTEVWLRLMALDPEAGEDRSDADRIRYHFAEAPALAETLRNLERFEEALALYREVADAMLPASDRYAAEGKVYSAWAAAIGRQIAERESEYKIEHTVQGRRDMRAELDRLTGEQVRRQVAAGDRYMAAFGAAPQGLHGNPDRLDRDTNLLLASVQYKAAQFHAKLAEALALYVEVNQGDSKKIAKPMIDLGTTYLKLGQPAKAMETFDRVIKDQAEQGKVKTRAGVKHETISYVARVWKGQALEDLGRFQEAADLYEGLMNMNPTNPQRIKANAAVVTVYHRIASTTSDPDVRATALRMGIARGEAFVARYGEKVTRDPKTEPALQSKAMAQRVYKVTFALAKNQFAAGSDAFKNQDLQEALVLFRSAQANYKKVARWDRGRVTINFGAERESELGSAMSLLRQATCSAEVDRGILEEARAEFRAVAGSHLRTREGLLALAGIRNCLRLMGRFDEAERVRERAWRALQTYIQSGRQPEVPFLEVLLAAEPNPEDGGDR